MHPNFENKLRQRLLDHEVTPPPEIWDNLSKNLLAQPHQKNTRRIFVWYFSAAASAAILVAAFFLKDIVFLEKKPAKHGSEQFTHNPKSGETISFQATERAPAAIGSRETAIVPAQASPMAVAIPILATPTADTVNEELDDSPPNAHYAVVPISQKPTQLDFTLSANINPASPQITGAASLPETTPQAPSKKEVSLPQLIGNTIAQKIGLKKAIQVTKKQNQDSKTLEITLFEGRLTAND